MTYTVYVLESTKNGLRYIGFTEDLEKRLKEHNSGLTAATRNKGPWRIIYREPFPNHSLAEKRERFRKSGKGREVLKNLLSNVGA